MISRCSVRPSRPWWIWESAWRYWRWWWRSAETWLIGFCKGWWVAFRWIQTRPSNTGRRMFWMCCRSQRTRGHDSYRNHGLPMWRWRIQWCKSIAQGLLGWCVDISCVLVLVLVSMVNNRGNWLPLIVSCYITLVSVVLRVGHLNIFALPTHLLSVPLLLNTLGLGLEVEKLLAELVNLIRHG